MHSGDMHGRRHALQGVCMAGGHVWQEGMYGRGKGVCMVGVCMAGGHVCNGCVW